VIAADRSALPPVGPDPEFRFPTLTRTTLANGLRAVTAEHRGAPVVSLALLIPTGASTDPPDGLGLAAFTADLLDEGCGDLSGVALHEALSRIGGHLGTEVTSDATTLSLTVLSRHLRRGMALLSEIAARPRFDPVDVARVRDLRLTRFRQMRQSPSAIADQVFLKSLYRGHPYGHLAMGTEATLAGLGVDAVTGFHRRAYRPATWTLVAVGDCVEAELGEAAAETFGQLQIVAGPEATDASALVALPVAAAEDRMVFVPRDGAVQSEIRLGHVGVARRSPDYHALLVLNTVLGGQFVSRINLNLREAKGYTYGARSGFDCRVAPGPFSVAASVQTAATADAIREAVSEIVDIRGARPVTDAELALARAALTRGFPRSFETAPQVAYGVLRLSLHGLPDDSFTRFVQRITAIDIDAVTRAASTHLRPDDLLAVVVGSRPDVLDSLGALGFGAPVEHRLPAPPTSYPHVGLA
jgi:zinc protease